MKKVVALIMSVVIVAVSTMFVIAGNNQKGDVNKDGSVTSADALEILRYIVGMIPEIDKDSADVNGDSKINSSDALEVLKIVVGLVTPSDPTPVTPPSNSTADIVNFYNNALRKTYAQSSFTVEKSESVSLQLGQIYLNGKPATGIQGIVDKVVASNSKPKHGTKNFSSNPVVDTKERYILPTGLTTGDVASANVSKNGSGYVVTFKLVDESCDFTKRPPHNSSCTFPLDFAEIDLGALGQVTSADFYYPGTTLKAIINSTGKVVQTYVVMPLEVSNAQGTGLGQDIYIDRISGTWTCTNTMSADGRTDYTTFPSYTTTTTKASITTTKATTTNRMEMPIEEVYNRLAVQRKFSFNKAYDKLSGIGNFFLDSITAYFEYDDKYWLIEFWKGEYAFGAVGCEIGFYTTEKNSTNTYTYENRGPEWLLYKSVADADAMKVSMKMWQYKSPDNLITPVQKIDYNIDQPHWWAADFATGTLYNHSDRTTLVMVGSILFPNATIKNLFVNAMKEKGFTEGTINTYHNVETLQVEGNKVTVCWRNYADAHQVSRNS